MRHGLKPRVPVTLAAGAVLAALGAVGYSLWLTLAPEPGAGNPQLPLKTESSSPREVQSSHVTHSASPHPRHTRPTVRPTPTRLPPPVHASPTRAVPTPHPTVHPRPTVTPTPKETPTVTEAQKALNFINELRENLGRPLLARYTGMDAAAEDQADRHVLEYLHDYAYVISSGDGVTWSREVYDPMFTKAGVGYHGGYWILILNY